MISSSQGCRHPSHGHWWISGDKDYWAYAEEASKTRKGPSVTVRLRTEHSGKILLSSLNEAVSAVPSPGTAVAGCPALLRRRSRQLEPSPPRADACSTPTQTSKMQVTIEEAQGAQSWKKFSCWEKYCQMEQKVWLKYMIVTDKPELNCNGFEYKIWKCTLNFIRKIFFCKFARQICKAWPRRPAMLANRVSATCAACPQGTYHSRMSLRLFV